MPFDSLDFELSVMDLAKDPVPQDLWQDPVPQDLWQDPLPKTNRLIAQGQGTHALLNQLTHAK